MGANGGEWRPLGENFVLGIAILRGDPYTALNNITSNVQNVQNSKTDITYKEKIKSRILSML